MQIKLSILFILCAFMFSTPVEAQKRSKRTKKGTPHWVKVTVDKEKPMWYFVDSYKMIRPTKKNKDQRMKVYIGKDQLWVKASFLAETFGGENGSGTGTNHNNQPGPSAYSTSSTSVAQNDEWRVITTTKVFESGKIEITTDKLDLVSGETVTTVVTIGSDGNQMPTGGGEGGGEEGGGEEGGGEEGGGESGGGSGSGGNSGGGS